MRCSSSNSCSTSNCCACCGMLFRCSSSVRWKAEVPKLLPSHTNHTSPDRNKVAGVQVCVRGIPPLRREDANCCREWPSTRGQTCESGVWCGELSRRPSTKTCSSTTNPPATSKRRTETCTAWPWPCAFRLVVILRNNHWTGSTNRSLSAVFRVGECRARLDGRASPGQPCCTSGFASANRWSTSQQVGRLECMAEQGSHTTRFALQQPAAVWYGNEQEE